MLCAVYRSLKAAASACLSTDEGTRIAAKAEGGQILTSDTVRGIVAGKKFLFSDRGKTAMRGFDDPVKLYELSWREAGRPPLTPAQPWRTMSCVLG